MPGPKANHELNVHRSHVEVYYPDDPENPITVERRDLVFHCLRCTFIHNAMAKMRMHAASCTAVPGENAGVEGDDREVQLPLACTPPDASGAEFQGPVPGFDAHGFDSGVDPADSHVRPQPDPTAPHFPASDTRFPSAGGRTGLRVSKTFILPRTTSIRTDELRRAHTIARDSDIDLHTEVLDRELEEDLLKRISHNASISPPDLDVDALTTHIRPDDRCVFNELCSKFGLVYLPIFRALVCTTCEEGVLPTQLYHHLKSIHGLPATKDIVAELAGTFLLAPDRKITKPTTTIPPLFGLELQPQRYFCTGCRSGYSTIQSMNVHFTRCATDHGKQYEFEFAQRVYPQVGRSGAALFAVHAPSPPDLSTPAEAMASALFESIPREDQRQMPMQPPDNPNARSLFLRRENWDNHVLGLCPATIEELLECPPAVSEPAVRSACETYLKNVQHIIRGSDSNMLLRIARWSS